MDLLTWAMQARETVIIDRFASLPGAVRIPVWGLGQQSWGGHDHGYLGGARSVQKELDAVYVPGARPDRVLLVAHTDTVWPGPPTQVVWGPDEKRKTMCAFSLIKGRGIGADDRAGVAALWALRKMGHSLLLVPGEERGCIGSTEVAAKHAGKITDHSFALQFDRRNMQDLVFYQGKPGALLTLLEANYPGYQLAEGSVTDICKLCPALKIAGANISIGYQYEHTHNELLVLEDWIKTVLLTWKFLATPNLPTIAYESRYAAPAPYTPPVNTTTPEPSGGEVKGGKTPHYDGLNKRARKRGKRASKAPAVTVTDNRHKIAIVTPTCTKGGYGGVATWNQDTKEWAYPPDKIWYCFKCDDYPESETGLAAYDQTCPDCGHPLLDAHTAETKRRWRENHAVHRSVTVPPS